MNTKNSEQYLRTAAAAKYLSLSKSTLDKLRVTGGGPAFSSLGRVVVYCVDELDSWVRKNQKRSTADTQ